MSGFAPVDLLAAGASGDGVAWSSAPEGLNANLVVLAPGAGIGEHRNDAVDVLVIVLAGAVTVTVDGATHEMAAGAAGVVPRGAARAVRAGAEGARYLSIHRARGALQVGPRRRGLTREGPAARPGRGSRPDG
ncbi:MAG TPA: cupin domain-containing protein [Acidimicrobiales bacterium]|nr:cupin domain-containing protein [Acidimicrobiales bacterium]